MICSGANGQVFEVEPDGTEIWRYIVPLDNGGVMNQGENPPSGGGGGPGSGPNTIFRAERYELNFAGFSGKDMTPGPPIENYPFCNGDLNYDRMVDGADLAIILTNWDTTNQTADLNDDGLVDAADMGILFAGWGPCD